MKKTGSENQQVKLVENEEQPVQLKISEEVEVLKPAQTDPGLSKTLEPDVSEILNTEETQSTLEEEWGKNKRAIPYGWFVLAGSVILGLGLWSLYNVFKAQPETVHANEEKQELLVDAEKENKVVKQTLISMEDCVRGYLSASDVDSMLAYVRHPERVKPLMEHHYQTHNITPGEFLSFSQIRSMGIESQPFVFAKVDLTDRSSRKVLIEQLDEGEFKVDWESDVCYLPTPWTDYIEQASSTPQDIRVYAKPDHFYAYEFSDDDAYQCYRLTTRDFEGYVFGYVKKGSPADFTIKKAINKSLQLGRGSREPMILRLSFPEGSSSKACVIIHEILAPRWTYVTSPSSDETTK